MRPMRELLDEAQKGAYAVGAFNVYNYETIFGVVKAAQEEKVPTCQRGPVSRRAGVWC